jgi:hypothetical protein
MQHQLSIAFEANKSFPLCSQGLPKLLTNMDRLLPDPELSTNPDRALNPGCLRDFSTDPTPAQGPSLLAIKAHVGDPEVGPPATVSERELLDAVQVHVVRDLAFVGLE